MMWLMAHWHSVAFASLTSFRAAVMRDNETKISSACLQTQHNPGRSHVPADGGAVAR
jgi:hypothetical protein